MVTLATERLILRPFRRDDLEDFHRFSRNPRVGPGAGWRPHQSLKESQTILRGCLNREGYWAIADRVTGTVMGSIGLHPDHRRKNGNARSLGYALDEPYWGRGFATEAAREALRHGFRDRELDLISAFCFPSNRRSHRVLEKCGFRYEGCLRMAGLLFDGSVYDEHCYSLTRGEYEEACGK